MKISIIGSGWLAQPLAGQLIKNGHEVMMTSTRAEKVARLTQNGLDIRHYQLGDELSADDQLLDVDLLIIAITSKDIDAYQKLIKQVKSDQTQAIIYISSTSVYANSDEPHDENSPRLNFDNPLLDIEQVIQSHPQATIIRFAGLVGPKRHPGRFFAGGKTITNPQARVNLIHLDDCLGIILAIINNQAWGEVFNGCADNHPAKGDFYPAMTAQLGAEPPLLDNKKGETSDKTILNHKVKNSLNYVLQQPDVFKFSY
ncbi:NAD(P)H-binding protein [Marinicella sp. S1101]|uniref:NAD(P)H-binding protein n=1 Tax=Marinicella marina TaxID=2996016 RepID=UPI0022609643|nr:NAD(P)H-binding protein [Marinicella marina]MCX7554973.1 NAD(P)H-binding protein [Marinicella marina]MDJ1141583.1 NAD(P)H-binding protein [Marinicella marina]